MLQRQHLAEFGEPEWVGEQSGTPGDPVGNGIDQHDQIAGIDFAVGAGTHAALVGELLAIRCRRAETPPAPWLLDAESGWESVHPASVITKQVAAATSLNERTVRTYGKQGLISATSPNPQRVTNGASELRLACVVIRRKLHGEPG